MAENMTEKEKFLDDDTQKKLKKMRGFSVKAEFPYTPKIYREAKLPKDVWPIFVLRSKDGLQLAEVEDNAGSVFYDTKKDRVEQDLKTGTRRLETLRSGILRISNWEQDDGTKYAWGKDSGALVITEKDGTQKTTNVIPVDFMIKKMNIELQGELQNAINERAEMSPEETEGLKF